LDIKSKRRDYRCGWLILIVVMLVGMTRAADLSARQQIFNREWSKLDKAYEKERLTATEQYSIDLQNVLQYMENRGDEFGARPTKLEIERFAREKNIPDDPEVGTPELIITARSRYRAAVEPINKKLKKKRTDLVDQYVSHLEILKARDKAKSDTNNLQAIQAEILRVSTLLEDEENVEQRVRLAIMPGKFAKGLSLIYLMGSAQKKQIPDQSANRRHGQLLGTSKSKTDDDAIEFLEYQDALELKPLRLGSQWTMVIEAHFPLNRSDKMHVLASGGFRQDHIKVNESGMLGICVNNFIGSGYSVNSLKGWQRIAVVAYNGRTYFYIGGEAVGIAKGICKEPLQVLGNSTGSGSPWGGAIRAVMVWRRSISKKEMMSLPTSLTLKP